jgi:hypothetical protein
MQSVLQQSFWDRFSGVVALQRPVYEAIPRDPEATGQALLIVLLLGLGDGIGIVVTGIAGLPPDVAALAPELADFLAFETTAGKSLAIAVSVVGALLSWYVSSWLLRAIGTRMAGPGARAMTPDEMRRLVGWGYSPSLASFLAPIPLVGPFLALFGTLWALVTGIMAVRVAFDVSIGKAIAIEVVAFLAILVLIVVLVSIAVTIALLFGA